jgi:UDP-N-acetylmuramate dehydrogenase
MKLSDEIVRRGFSGRVGEQVALSGFTTYAIGGPAEVLVEPASAEDVRIILEVVKESGAPLYVLGGGSKILAPDEEVRGIVMVVGDLMAGIEVRGSELQAGAGVRNPVLAERTVREGLEGLEWIYDIPGRVGGSIVQNTGMSERSISDRLVDVTYMRGDGGLRTSPLEDLRFGYRWSSFKAWGDAVIVSARFRLPQRADASELRGKMEEITRARHGKFPVECPSCGSVFKRPEGRFPGKLIEDCGLGGRKAGGAVISTRHHNFIVNTGGAASKDVRTLVELIVAAVREKTGITLERELLYLEEIRFGGGSGQ